MKLGHRPIRVRVDVQAFHRTELDEGDRLHDARAFGDDVAQARADHAACLDEGGRQPLAVDAPAEERGRPAVVVERPAQAAIVAHGDHAGGAGGKARHGLAHGGSAQERARRLHGDEHVALGGAALARPARHGDGDSSSVQRSSASSEGR